jgi:hypothetical protein
VRRVAVLIAMTAVVAGAPAAAQALPPIKHVFVIWLENKGYDETFKQQNPKAPYLATTLPAMGSLLPEYYAIGHLSLDNYIAVISGQGPNPQTQSDCQFYTDFTPGTMGADGQAMGSGCVYPTAVPTLANQLEGKGLTWKGYMEDMAKGPLDQTTCRHPAANQQDSTQSAKVGDQYAARHNPFVYFHSIIDGPSCRQNDVDLSLMPGDIASSATTASFSFITPNLCSDGHDEPCVDKQPGGLTSIDKFLREWVPKILNSPGYKDNGLLVVSFDEAQNSDASACCGEVSSNTPNAGGTTSGPGGGKVGAVLISPFIQPASGDHTPYNHYSFLRTMEDLFKVPHLGYAAMSGLVPFGDQIFNQTPKVDLAARIVRRDRGHVRVAVDAGRQVTVSFAGVCKAPSRDTSEDGKLNATLSYRRSGRCTVTASREAWSPGSKTFRLKVAKKR